MLVIWIEIHDSDLDRNSCSHKHPYWSQQTQNYVKKYINHIPLSAKVF